MTEEIIIDGVNVAGCKHYKTETCLADYLFTDMAFSEAKCVLSPNCYYKQLKRLEQERDILLRQLVINDGEDVTVQISQSQFDEYNELKQENKELKEKIQILNKDSYTRLREMTVLDAELDEFGVINNNYRSALEEIREMILYCEDEYNCYRCKYHDNCLVDDDKFPDFNKALVNKINEVLNV